MRSEPRRRLGIWCLVSVLLVGLSLPRFGFVWHDHEHPDEEHDEPQLLRLLASSEASHPVLHPPQHQAHHHTDASDVVLTAVDPSNVHAHYVDASLLVFIRALCPLTPTFLCVSLPPPNRQVFWARRLAPLPARAPPASLLLISRYCSTRGRALHVI
jgi:hypothetical protein